MSDSRIIRTEFWQGSDIRLMARVLKPDSTVLTTADCGLRAIRYQLYDLSLGDLPVQVFGAVNVFTSSAVFPIGTVAGWSGDSIGANFLLVVQNNPFFATTAAVGGHRYRLEVRIRTTSFGDLRVTAEMNCKSLIGS